MAPYPNIWRLQTACIPSGRTVPARYPVQPSRKLPMPLRFFHPDRPRRLRIGEAQHRKQAEATRRQRGRDDRLQPLHHAEDGHALGHGIYRKRLLPCHAGRERACGAQGRRCAQSHARREPAARPPRPACAHRARPWVTAPPSWRQRAHVPVCGASPRRAHLHGREAQNDGLDRREEEEQDGPAAQDGLLPALCGIGRRQKQQESRKRPAAALGIDGRTAPGAAPPSAARRRGGRARARLFPPGRMPPG